MALDRKPPIWTKDFIGITLSNFFLFLIYFALMTMLPIYVVEDLQRTETEAGLAVAVFLISAVLFRPFSGKLLQDYGRRKMLILCMLFFLISTLLYMWADNYYWLLALRFFHGIWFSIASTATGAIAADMVPAARRGEGLGYFVMSNNIAVVVGPFISLTLVQFTSFDWLFFTYGVLMFIGAAYVIFINIPASKHPLQQARKLSFDDLFERNAIPIAIVGSLIAFAYSSVLSFISVYAKELNLLEAAGYFFAVLAAFMLISRPFVGRLFDVKGAKIVVFPTMIIFLIGLMTLSFTQSAFLLLLGAALVGIGYGSLVPCLQTLAIQSAERHRSGHATATFFTFFDSGIGVGSFVLGWIASLFGYAQLYFYTSLFLLLPLFLFSRVHSRKNVKNQKDEAPI